MGQGSQSGMNGQHPAWSQMAQMGGSQLPDPMQRAREQFEAARNQYAPVHADYWSKQGAERYAMKPEYLQARSDFLQTRDWHRDLQGMPEATQTGTAAMGPPRPIRSPQFAPMLEVPQMPGLNHDGTVQGLLSVLQQQTANQTFGGGNAGGGGGSGPAMVETPDGNMAPEDWQDRYERPAGWNGNVASRR